MARMLRSAMPRDHSVYHHLYWQTVNMADQITLLCGVRPSTRDDGDMPWREAGERLIDTLGSRQRARRMPLPIPARTRSGRGLLIRACAPERPAMRCFARNGMEVFSQFNMRAPVSEQFLCRAC